MKIEGLKAEQTALCWARLQEISAKEMRNWTIDDWVVGLHSIYADRNELKSPMEIWLHVANDCSQLAEEVRKGYLEDVVREAAKLLGRISCFVGKYLYQGDFAPDDPIGTLLRDQRSDPEDFVSGQEGYSKWILQKYPGRCRTCGEPNCLCPAHKPITENRDKNPEGYRRLREGALQGVIKALQEKTAMVPTEGVMSQVPWNKIQTRLPLDEMFDLFHPIFGGGHFDLDLWKITAHLMEEIGEVANEILYLAELKEIDLKYTGPDGKPYASFHEDLRKALVDAGGLYGKVDAYVVSELKASATSSGEALAYVRRCIARTLKEELADVFSWLSALLWKIGDTWRYAQEPKTGHKAPYYEFWPYLSDYYEIHEKVGFGCSFCRNRHCQPSCRPQSLMAKVIRKRDKEEWLWRGIREFIQKTAQRMSV